MTPSQSLDRDNKLLWWLTREDFVLAAGRRRVVLPPTRKYLHYIIIPDVEKKTMFSRQLFFIKRYLPFLLINSTRVLNNGSFNKTGFFEKRVFKKQFPKMPVTELANSLVLVTVWTEVAIRNIIISAPLLKQ